MNLHNKKIVKDILISKNLLNEQIIVLIIKLKINI